MERAPGFEELKKEAFRDMVKAAYRALRAEGVKDRQMCDGQIFMWIHDAYGFDAKRDEFRRLLLEVARDDPEIEVEETRCGIIYVKVRGKRASMGREG